MANKIKVSIDGDSKGLKKELSKTQKQTKSWSQKVSSSFGGAGAAMAAVGGAAAAGALVKGISSAVNKAEEMNSLYAITETIIEDTGGAARVSSEQVKDMAKELAFSTGISKAAITEGTNLILTFKNIANQAGKGNDIFDRTNKIMLDMSTVMGTDAKGSAIQLGKALNDPITGISALTRVGVTFTSQQKAQIRTMQQAGDTVGAQKIILEELESQFEGTAEASADDTAKIGRAFDEVTEAIGNAFLPAIAEMVPSVQKLSDRITSNTKLFKGWGRELADWAKDAGIVLDLLGGLGSDAQDTAESGGFLASAWGLAGDAIKFAINPAGELQDKVNGLVQAEQDAEQAARDLAAAQQAAVGGDIADKMAIMAIRSDQMAESLPKAAKGMVDIASNAEDALGPFATLAERSRSIATLLGGLEHLETVAANRRGGSGGGTGVVMQHGGGVVPGRFGQDVPTILQAGERVIPRAQAQNQGGGGGGVVVNVQGFVGSELELAEVIDQMLTRRRASSGLEFQS